MRLHVRDEWGLREASIRAECARCDLRVGLLLLQLALHQKLRLRQRGQGAVVSVEGLQGAACLDAIYVLLDRLDGPFAKRALLV